MCVGVEFFVYLVYYLLSILFCKFISFSKFAKICYHFFRYFFQLHTFSSPSVTPMRQMLDLLLLAFKSLKLCSFPSVYFLSLQTGWFLFTYLYIQWFFPLSSLFCSWTPLVSFYKKFHLLYFSILFFFMSSVSLLKLIFLYLFQKCLQLLVGPFFWELL